MNFSLDAVDLAVLLSGGILKFGDISILLEDIGVAKIHQIAESSLLVYESHQITTHVGVYSKTLCKKFKDLTPSQYPVSHQLTKHFHKVNCAACLALAKKKGLTECLVQEKV